MQHRNVSGTQSGSIVQGLLNFNVIIRFNIIKVNEFDRYLILMNIHNKSTMKRCKKHQLCELLKVKDI